MTSSCAGGCPEKHHRILSQRKKSTTVHHPAETLQRHSIRMQVMYLHAEARGSVLCAPHYTLIHGVFPTSLHPPHHAHRIAHAPSRCTTSTKSQPWPVIVAIPATRRVPSKLTYFTDSHQHLDAWSSCTNGYIYANLALTSTEIHRAQSDHTLGSGEVTSIVIDFVIGSSMATQLWN